MLTSPCTLLAAGGIEIPENDHRDYRFVKLPNGMAVLLISDPSIDDPSIAGETAPASCLPCLGRPLASQGSDSLAGTRKAACAIAVGAGYLSDPATLQGCAHYVEHMLFMGTKAYPRENAWSSFLSRHGGVDNGETFAEHTVFCTQTGA